VLNDALNVTESLCYRYVWIDPLYILQDDEDDIQGAKEDFVATEIYLVEKIFEFDASQKELGLAYEKLNERDAAKLSEMMKATKEKVLIDEKVNRMAMEIED
jgi:hypothetical protein